MGQEAVLISTEAVATTSDCLSWISCLEPREMKTYLFKDFNSKKQIVGKAYKPFKHCLNMLYLNLRRLKIDSWVAGWLAGRLARYRWTLFLNFYMIIDGECNRQCNRQISFRTFGPLSDLKTKTNQSL